MARSLPPYLLGLALVACGGQTSGSNGGSLDGGNAPLDAANGDEGPTAHTHFLTYLNYESDRCSPQALVADAQGLVACSIFELPTNGGGCDASLGLSPVASDVAAAVQAAAQVPSSQVVCQLAQLPESDWVGGTCAGSSSPGWCYVSGPAAGSNCPQAIRLSPTGTPGPAVRMLFGC
jgi:hypothetical protein